MSSLLAALYLSGRQSCAIDSEEADEVRRSHLFEIQPSAVIDENHPGFDGTRDNSQWRILDAVAVRLLAEQLSVDQVNAQLTRIVKRQPSSMAYSVWTSGTSADPKLIEMSRPSIEQYCREFVSRYKLNETSILALWAQPNYDAFYCQLISGLIAGSKAIVPDRMSRVSGKVLHRWIEGSQITHFETTPSVLDRLVAAALQEQLGWPMSLREVMCSGEQLTPSLAASSLALAGSSGVDMRLHNEYGPSECILLTWHEVTLDDLDLESLPVGTLIDGRSLTLVPEVGHEEVTATNPGEIVVTSRYLCAGYGSSRAGSVTRFPADADGVATFATGDLGYYDQTGRLRLSGRRDRTVKRQGVKINLDQIEAAFIRLPSVLDAAARVSTKREGSGVVVWAVTDGPSASSQLIMQEATSRIPIRYLPDQIVVCTELPRLTSGKVDYRSLEVPTESDDQSDAVDEAISTAVVQAFAELLPGVEPGLSTNFFAAGGHSLMALELCRRLELQVGVRLTLRDALSNPTVSALAERVAVLAENREKPPQPIQHNQTYQNHLTVAERPLWARSQLLGEDGAANVVGGFVIETSIGVERLRHTVEKVVAEVPACRTSFNLEGGSPVRVLHRCAVSADVEVVEVRGRPDEFTDPEVLKEAYRPFDLSVAPLVRVLLVESRGQSTASAIYLVAHHIVCDGVSMNLLVERLQRRLANPFGTQGDTRSCIEVADARGNEEVERTPHWDQTLSSLREFPFDTKLICEDVRTAPMAQTVTFDLATIDRCARVIGISIPAVLITTAVRACVDALGRPALVVESPVSLRTPRQHDVIGNFVVDVPMLISGDLQILKLARRAETALLDVIDAAASSPGFGRVRPGQSTAPIGDIVVVVEDKWETSTIIDGAETAPIVVPGSPPRHPLAFYFLVNRSRATVTCTVTGLASAAIIRSVADEVHSAGAELASAASI